MRSLSHRPAWVASLVLAGLLTSAPAARADDGDEWFGADKALHFGVSATIAAAAYAATTPLFDARYPPGLISAGGTLAIGAGKEAYDAVSGGDPSWKDFTWDAIGMAVGLGLAYGLDLALRGVGPDHPLLGAPHVTSGPSTARVGAGLALTF